YAGPSLSAPAGGEGRGEVGRRAELRQRALRQSFYFRGSETIQWQATMPLFWIASSAMPPRYDVMAGIPSGRDALASRRRRGKVDLRAERDDAGRIDLAVAPIVMRLEHPEIDCLGHAGCPVKGARVIPQCRILVDVAQVAFEMAVMDGIEAHQGREEPPIRLGGAVADEMALPPEARLDPIERAEERRNRLLIGLLARGEAGLVDAVVDRVVNARVDRIDIAGEIARIKVRARVGEGGEGAVEHADDIGRFVVDDGALLLVPQDRHAGAPVGVRIGALIDLIGEARAGQRVGLGKGPALLQHERLDEADRDDVFQALQQAEQQRAVAPRAGERQIEVIASAGGGKSGAAVGGDPVAERARRALESAAALARVVPLVAPLTVDQHAHRFTPYLGADPLAAKWQAANCPAWISRMTGSSAAQRASASGQRVRKRQPLGGASGEGGSPSTTLSGGGASGSGCGMAASSAAV